MAIDLDMIVGRDRGALPLGILGSPGHRQNDRENESESHAGLELTSILTRSIWINAAVPVGALIFVPNIREVFGTKSAK